MTHWRRNRGLFGPRNDSHQTAGFDRGRGKTRHARRVTRWFRGREVETAVDTGAFGLSAAIRFLIAALSGPTPKIVIIRLRFVSQGDLGSDFVEGPGQEVGGTHPGLEGAERVFDGLSAHAHDVGHGAS
jgi:hypothetical protein